MLKLAKDLAFPIEIAGQAIAMFGIRGSGKTNSAGALAEELLDHGHPIAVIDPTDAWWGLRAGRDGSQAGGYQVFIFGGSHADIPLNETDGKVIAEFLVREQVPVVLSLRHLRKGAQRRFVTEFCEELYHLKGKDEHRTPLTVFIDEAPLFVPQKVLGEVARTVGAVEDLIARGRNAGFGVVLISQRSATLNADVRTQADTVICHRVTAPLDRKAISDWFEENATTSDLKTILQSLATLKNGEAWVWSPSIDIMSRVQMRMRRTFDSSATPKAGDTLRPPKKLAEVDLDKLKGQLAATIEKSKQEDPTELRKLLAQKDRRIAELEKKLGQQIPALDREQVKRLRQSVHNISGATEAVRKYIEQVQFNAGEIHDASFQLEPHVPNGATHPNPKAVVGAPRIRFVGTDSAGHVGPVQRVTPERSVVLSNGTPALGNSGLRRILVALAQRPHGLTNPQIGIRAGMASSGGSFRTYLSKARTEGWIEEEGPIRRITQAGLEALGQYEPLPTGRALLEYWLGELGQSGAARILRVVADAYPDMLDLQTIGERANMDPAGGSFRTYMSKLRTLELVQGGRGKKTCVSEELVS